MKLKTKDLERMYFALLTIGVCCILIYKYLKYGCVIICGEYYDNYN